MVASIPYNRQYSCPGLSYLRSSNKETTKALTIFPAQLKPLPGGFCDDPCLHGPLSSLQSHGTEALCSIVSIEFYPVSNQCLLFCVECACLANAISISLKVVYIQLALHVFPGPLPPPLTKNRMPPLPDPLSPSTSLQNNRFNTEWNFSPDIPGCSSGL